MIKSLACVVGTPLIYLCERYALRRSAGSKVLAGVVETSKTRRDATRLTSAPPGVKGGSLDLSRKPFNEASVLSTV